MPDIGAAEILGGVTLTGVGAGVLRLAQWWLERQGRVPSKTADAADLVTAAAAFQEALNTAAEGQIGALVARIAAIEKSHTECEARCDQLAGEVRALRQSNDSLIRQLRDPASTQPGGSLDGAVIQLIDGRADIVSTKAERASK
ncbi:hypothetical protein [Brevundimonas sp.]|uniref:hypothetical protein n=1 Tax=Brevundimonas sp. TaxID=1871086 RepID=UPI00286B5E88|nr:hypothetical protein [Brevundimonas sp.]